MSRLGGMGRGWARRIEARIGRQRQARMGGARTVSARQSKAGMVGKVCRGGGHNWHGGVWQARMGGARHYRHGIARRGEAGVVV